MKVISRRVTKSIAAVKEHQIRYKPGEDNPHEHLVSPRFKVSAPYAYLLPEEEVIKYGIPMGEGFDKNSPFNHNVTIASVSIEQLAIMFNKDAPFTLIKLKDSLEIVEIIFDHLKEWDEYLKGSGSYSSKGPDAEMTLMLSEYMQHLSHISYVVSNRGRVVEGHGLSNVKPKSLVQAPETMTIDTPIEDIFNEMEVRTGPDRIDFTKYTDYDKVNDRVISRREI